jgi:hypothetical protein
VNESKRMHRKVTRVRATKTHVLALLLSASLGSCTLPAHYSSEITASARSLQKDTAAFFYSIILTNGSAPGDFQKHADFYKNALASINQMKMDADIAGDTTNSVNLNILQAHFDELVSHDRERGIAKTYAEEKINRFDFLFKNILLKQQSGAAVSGSASGGAASKPSGGG